MWFMRFAYQRREQRGEEGRRQAGAGLAHHQLREPVHVEVPQVELAPDVDVVQQPLWAPADHRARPLGAVGVGALGRDVEGGLARADDGDALAPDQRGGVRVVHVGEIHGVEHPPAERVGADAGRELRDVGHAAESPDAQDQEVELVRLRGVGVAVTHGEAPPASAITAERLAVARPQLRVSAVVGADELRGDDLAPEPDAVFDAEAARVGGEVRHDLVVARERVGVFRPREVGEAVALVGRLQPGGGERARPQAADGGARLEHHRAEAPRQEVLGRGEPARAGADDGHTLRRLVIH